MIKYIAFLFVWSLLPNMASSQVQITNHTEVGYLFFRKQAVIYDVGPNFQGYFLEGVDGGLHINNSVGITNKKQRYFLGAGAGYMKLKDNVGKTFFLNSHIRFTKAEDTGVLSFKLGTSSLNKPNGRTQRTPFAEIKLGISSIYNKNWGLKTEFGTALLQESYFFVGSVTGQYTFR